MLSLNTYYTSHSKRRVMLSVKDEFLKFLKHTLL